MRVGYWSVMANLQSDPEAYERAKVLGAKGGIYELDDDNGKLWVYTQDPVLMTMIEDWILDGQGEEPPALSFEPKQVWVTKEGVTIELR